MKNFKFITVALLIITSSITGCGPKDASIETAIQEKLKAKEETAPAMVSVSKGEATLSGQLNSEAAKMESATIAQEVKGVKSIVNNITVSQPAPQTQPVVIAEDDPLTKSVADAIKDNAGVQATVENGVINLTGQIDKASLPRLMMKLNSLQPKKINNNLTVK